MFGHETSADVLHVNLHYVDLRTLKLFGLFEVVEIVQLFLDLIDEDGALLLRPEV